MTLQAKTFEIRDSATFIPACAIKLTPFTPDEADNYLIRRAGWTSAYGILFGRMEGGAWQHDPYQWGGSRTMLVAHLHIIEHWDKLQSGSVIDVQFILGETTAPKTSEREDGVPA